MNEYIKREDALTAVAGLLNVIEKMPSADVEPVRHGKWIEKQTQEDKEGGYAFGYYCSECDELCVSFINDDSRTMQRTRYCPNCGARMDGERKDGDKND